MLFTPACVPRSSCRASWLSLRRSYSDFHSRSRSARWLLFWEKSFIYYTVTLHLPLVLLVLSLPHYCYDVLTVALVVASCPECGISRSGNGRALKPWFVEKQWSWLNLDPAVGVERARTSWRASSIGRKEKENCITWSRSNPSRLHPREGGRAKVGQFSCSRGRVASILEATSNRIHLSGR